MGGSPADVTAEEVLGNIDGRLPAGTRLEKHAGRIREVQNWIGGSAYNPCTAAFVPPPDAVGDLLDDLARFCDGDSLPAVVQAALAHAQFETIHPFVDGNGRAGRALIHLIPPSPRHVCEQRTMLRRSSNAARRSKPHGGRESVESGETRRWTCSCASSPARRS